jgi:hypothetical protein
LCTPSPPSAPTTHNRCGCRSRVVWACGLVVGASWFHSVASEWPFVMTPHSGTRPRGLLPSDHTTTTYQPTDRFHDHSMVLQVQSACALVQNQNPGPGSSKGLSSRVIVAVSWSGRPNLVEGEYVPWRMLSAKLGSKR